MENEAPVLTRRDFIKYAAINGAAYFATAKALESDYSQPAESADFKENESQKHEIVDTIKESVGYSSLIIPFVFLAKEIFKIPIGNANIAAASKKSKSIVNKLYLEGDRKAFMKLGGLFTLSVLEQSFFTPTREELVFRFLPNLLIRDRSKKQRWEFGIPTSLLFAAFHNIKNDEQTDKYVFDTKTIPAAQFISGLFFWKHQRENGLIHAITAHTIVNISILPITFLEVFSFYGIKALFKK